MSHFSSLLIFLFGLWLTLVSSLYVPAPSEFNETVGLLKRADSLYSIWNSIPSTQKATGDSAMGFTIDQSVDNAWGITYLYGCTALMISDPTFVIVAHMQQVSAAGTICIKDQPIINDWLANQLQPQLDQYPPDNMHTQVDLIFNALDCNPRDDGLESIRRWLVNEDNWGVERENILDRRYTGSSVLGTPAPGSPLGLAAVQWTKPQLPDLNIGRIQVFFNSDTPTRDQTFLRGDITGQ